MEFKDNLKRLRTQGGLTQAQLAEKLFVSRSAVAKWENGLGLPSAETMTALEELFGVPMQELSTAEPEAVIVRKNRSLRIWIAIAVTVLTLALVSAVGYFALVYHIVYNGTYHRTPEEAIGNYKSNDSVDTGDYVIYFFCHKGSFSDGRQWRALRDYRIVKRHSNRYVQVYDVTTEQTITKDGEVAGKLQTVKGENGYYHLIRTKWLGSGTPSSELTCADAVTIDGVVYPLQSKVFFITEEPVTHFEIGDVRYAVTE